MNTSRKTLVAGLLAVMAVAPAFADKGGHGKGHDDDRDRVVRVERDDHHRAGDHDRRDERVVQVEPSHAQGCPPGLAKKHNGCMPPGQAKKWKKGQPLPREVVYYEVPPALVVKIGTPPPGYKYVRVASDILMIAIGTSLVVDAIQDLGRM